MTINLKKDVSYLTISDIHTLHKLNETAYIAESLAQYFDYYRDTSPFTKLDILFIAGDITDDRVDFKSPNVLSVLEIFRSIAAFCARHSIKLRILEGTRSHDNRQAVNFGPIANAIGPTLDYKYVDTVHIERMTDLGLDVLYIPDEYENSAAIAQEHFQQKLDELGIDKVDIACMHGMFDFQVPDLGQHPLKHDSQYYLSKVRAYINIGHVHVAAVMDRILIQGSFDRIAHGEPGKKGGIVCNLRRNGQSSYTFVENKRARVFHTVRLTSMDTDKSIAQVRKELKDIPDRSFVRIMAKRGHPVLLMLPTLKAEYPLITFKKETIEEKDADPVSAIGALVKLGVAYEPISITPQNIVNSIMREVTGNHALLGHEQAVLTEELNALVTPKAGT